MSTDLRQGLDQVPAGTDDTLVLLNRATLVMHTVRTAAHELNNLLQMITGSAEMLELNADFPPELTPRLQTILRHAGRGSELIGSVADLARGQRSDADVVDARRAIDRALGLRKYEHNRAAIKLTLTAPEDRTVLVRASALDMQLMLLNLIVNAEQAVADSAVKALAIGVTEAEAMCEISVIDSGSGLPEGADVFAPFFTTRAPMVASGLGLAATRTLAAKHGGNVQLRASGSGVEAVLMLPLARRAAEETAATTPR